MTRTTIQTADDGPLKVEGPVRLIKVDGCPYDAEKDPTFLYRCGASSTKPFREGSHAGPGTSPRAETAR